MGAALEYRILGPLEVLRGGEPVAVTAGMQRTLLAVLLLAPNEVVPSDRLIDALWGGRPPETAGTALHGLVSQLRRALEPERRPGEGGTVLLTRPPGYLLVVEPGALDAARFEALAAGGRAAAADGSPERGREQLGEALALWRGEALVDVRENPAVHVERMRLAELRLEVLEDRLDADLALGRHAELVPELEALVEREPLRERLRAQLMLALYRAGRQADALEAYRRTRETLVGELGIEPGPELRELEQRILRQDPTLAVTSPAARRRRRRRLAVAVAAAIAAVAAVGGLAAWRLLDEPDPLLAHPGEVAVVDPRAGRVVDTVEVAEGLAAVAYGHGSVWAASADDRTVTRIDPASRHVQKVIGVGRPCVQLAISPGAVWVANGSAGTLTRLDPASGREAAVIDLSGDDPLVRQAVHGVAFGFGRVWAAVGTGTVVRIDPRTNTVERRFEVGAAPISIASGLGSIWVGTAAERVLRIDPRSGRVTARVPVVGWPVDLAVADGLVLVSAESMWVVDPATVTLAPTPRIGTRPVGAADVPGPGAWVAEARDGVVVELAPSSRRGREPVPAGSEPSALAYGGGLLWVAVREPQPVS